jgi:hypothetical protein
MPGGLRRAVAGGAVLGLLVAGLVAASVGGPAHAAPATCTMTDSSELTASLYDGYVGQASSGTWTDVNDDGDTRPWFGLYDPASAPDHTRLGPRVQNFGATSTLPATPVQTGDHFQWRLRGVCKESGAAFIAAGEGMGSCYRSVGVGRGAIGTTKVTVRWEAAGTQLVLVDPSATGTLATQTRADANDSCQNGTATEFMVSGAVVGAG